METVKVTLGRAVWLFDTQEINPRGAALFPDLYLAFGKRYQFAVLPKSEEIHAGGSMYFKSGKFLFGAENIVVDFELHNDGLVANTRHSTEGADAFLQDVLDWCSEQLGVKYRSSLVNKKTHRSELIVSMNPKLDAISVKLEEFAGLVTPISATPATVMGLQFGSQSVPAAFGIERRAGNVSLEENQYLTNAWTTTTLHLELLRKFERLLG